VAEELLYAAKRWMDAWMTPAQRRAVARHYARVRRRLVEVLDRYVTGDLPAHEQEAALGHALGHVRRGYECRFACV
jgi:hypothetical protein